MSLEDIEEIVVVSNVEKTGYIAEMVEAQAKACVIDEYIDTIADDTQTLEKLADVIEANQEVGLNQNSAEVIATAVESIYNRCGVRSKAMPGFEAFTDNSKVMFTKIALEDIKEGIAKIWKLIVEAIKAAYASVVEFLKKIFNSAAGVKKKAENLTEKIKTLSLSTEKSQDDIEVSSPVASEDMGSNFRKKLSPSSISLIFSDKTDAPSVFRASDSLVKCLTEMPAIFELVDKSCKITELLLTEFGDKKSVDNITYPTFTKGLQHGEREGTYRSEMFPGGMALNVIGLEPNDSAKGLDSIKGMSKTSIRIAPWSEKQSLSAHKTVPVLNRASIDRLLSESISISTAVEKLEGPASKLQAQFKALTTQAGQFSVESDNPTTEMKQALSDLKGTVNAVKTICSTGLPMVMSYSLRVSNAFIDYCEVSLMCYKTSKA